MKKIKNFEIKARSNRNKELHQILINELNAEYIGCDNQVDTYFNVPKGRLKHRRGNIENSLIYYERSDEAKSRESKITLEKLESNNNLDKVLGASIGVMKVVDKKRKIFFVDNVKFHLDTVEGLGEFLEIEAIDSRGDSSLEKLKSQCDHYIQRLGIEEADFESQSYSDLVTQ